MLNIGADKARLWLDKEIWPEIQAMLSSDAYFRLLLKAHEFAQTPYGPIAQMIVNGYATYQIAAVRRLCDKSKGVVSLPKLLEMIEKNRPDMKRSVSALRSRLERECAELYALATQYIAHNGNPNSPNGREWNLTSDKIVAAQKAICEVTIIIERDLLAVTYRPILLPVFQSDYLAEVKAFVPADKLDELRNFWHAHNDGINAWTQVPRLATPKLGQVVPRQLTL